MEHNEDRISLKDIPTSTFPLPPRFDAAASAAARPVEPLPSTRIQIDFPLKPKFSQLINKRSKFLALMAIIGLATGAAGGILVVERDKQQRVENSASMIQMPIEQTPASESTAPALENNDASLDDVSEPVENQVRVRRRQRQPRKQPSELVVRSDADEEDAEEEDAEELDRDRDDDDDRDKDNENRKKDRERSRRDRERDADSRRRESTRQRAVLYDTMRVRKP